MGIVRIGGLISRLMDSYPVTDQSSVLSSDVSRSSDMLVARISAYYRVSLWS